VPVPSGASSAWAREVKPRFRPRPARAPWKPANAIPQLDRAELRRRVAEVLETYKQHREAMRAVAQQTMWSAV
jgi:hypothetical protein